MPAYGPSSHTGLPLTLIGIGALVVGLSVLTIAIAGN